MKLTNLLFILFHDMQNAFENITVLLQRRWKLSNTPVPNNDEPGDPSGSRRSRFLGDYIAGRLRRGKSSFKKT